MTHINTYLLPAHHSPKLPARPTRRWHDHKTLEPPSNPARFTWRSAQRLGAELDLLWVTDHDPNHEEQQQLDALRRLASVLGAHLLIEHGDDIARVTQRIAHERGTTYILIGAPKPRSALRRLTQPALPFRLLALLPSVDLRIVADRTQRTKENT